MPQTALHVPQIRSGVPSARVRQRRPFSRSTSRSSSAFAMGRRMYRPKVRIPIESDHLFRSNPIADSGVSDHLAGAGVS